MKWKARITRDIIRKINMGPLVVSTMRDGAEQEIAPARTIELPLEAGTVSVHRTKRHRDAFVAAINGESPGAAVTED